MDVMKRLVFKITDTGASAYSAISEEKFVLFIRELEEGGEAFDPDVAEIGTITPVNTPIVSNMTVNEAFEASQGQIDFTKWVVVNSDITAENSRFYVVTANATFTDPTPVDGLGYFVLVRKGVATIDSVAYSNYRIIYRFCMDGGFVTFDFPVIVDANGTYKGIAKLYDSLGANTDGAVDQATVTNEINAINFNINNVLENEILQNGLVWMVPLITGIYGSAAASTQYLRTATSPIVQNNPTPSFFGLSIATFETTSVAGVLAFLRSHQNTNISLYSNIITVRDFRVDANISSDCRYWLGFSQNYTFAAPTNTDPSVHTECIYVAKLSTSNNLHIVHNDNAGVATTIDLGANFPANNDTYKFRMYLIKESASSYYLTVYRTTIATGVVLASSTYHLTANLPTNSAALIQICTITNNATATNMRLGDYGLIIKNLPL